MATPKKVKIKILLPVAGAFRLSYNVGETVSVAKNVADELVEAKYAELVK